jgi:hypothetical protein
MRQQWNSAGSDPHATLGRVRGDEARTKELHNLRVALAMFALQLDAFELRIREGRLRPSQECRAWRPTAGGRLQKE